MKCIDKLGLWYYAQQSFYTIELDLIAESSVLSIVLVGSVYSEGDYSLSFLLKLSWLLIVAVAFAATLCFVLKIHEILKNKKTDMNPSFQ